MPTQPDPDGSASGNGDDLERMLRSLLGDNAAQLSAASGLPLDTEHLSQMFAALRRAMTTDGIDWSAAEQQAQQRADAQQLPITDEERTEVGEATRIAALWLTETTSFTPPADGGVMNRREWVDATMPFWERLCEPIVLSITRTLQRSLQSQAPEQMRPLLAQAGAMMRAVASTIFGMQLGTVIGDLAGQVVSANEIGVPMLPGHRAALLPQNVVDFADGLDDVPEEQARIYLACRELAHVALFRAAPWLTSQLALTVQRYADGIPDVLSQVDVDIDPNDPESLRVAIESGALIPPPTADQQAAVRRLETLLTLIEGWVDEVARTATARLPRAAAVAEMFNRRRAEGGPAEQAFGSLVHLELRPKRLRQAATLWETLTEQLGVAARDRLWQHPDVLPDSAAIDDPKEFLAAYRAENDELDDDLERLLEGGFTAPGPADADESGAGSEDGDSGDEPTDGDRPQR